MRKSSAGYAAFLPGREGAVLSASPELFFRIEPSSGGGARIVAEPIKGTRPRGATPEEDAALAAALLADPKDRAENVMIADLTRNDLSRICRDGGVREEAICALATHAGVHHLVSRIGGELLDGVDAAAALRALFPCGSITGAPKIEAMRAIAEIEGEGRGPYCGAIGFIDDAGASTFSVAIRTAVAERRSAALRLSLPVGGGVTLRSDSDAEYEETRTKARGLLAALGAAEPAA
jgi:para-aminobenzoate synthetase component 1